MTQLFLSLSAISGFTAVALGAFGAHALKGRLDDSLMAAYQTGVQYQFVHTLALLAVVVLSIKITDSSTLRYAGVFFVAGIFLFCGSLYGLALGGPRWLGPITPVGGLSFLLGWLCLFWASRQLEL